MTYKVLVTSDAQDDLEGFIKYLIFEKKNKQAAANVMDDFEKTKETLSRVAASIKLCENPRLKKLGYRRINFEKHSYFMMYRVEESVAIVDNIFHSLQDYENKLQ
ncbi:MAG: type II toxin-antitoxin system RelE/ParE family toxin [Lachnospiraceae bacterium]|nr:type II toxin-antitoxin system RelE/ParE family toxin [Lachnospiraceae bacterium]